MNKYGAVIVRGVQGIMFRSKAERDHALWLEAERRSGRIKKWEYEVCYELFAYYGAAQTGKIRSEIGRHRPDFTITLPDGRTEVHEVKGGSITKTEAWGLRKKIFEANYPHIRYRVFEFGSERRARVIRWE